ncbi:MAG: hypothetical protein PVI04_01625 [Anaerolineales bacterium]
MNPDQTHRMEEILSGMRPNASPAFRDALRAEIQSAAAVKKHGPSWSLAALGWTRAWKPLVLVFVLATLYVFLTPTGRALAQKLLRVGIYLVTNGPTDAEGYITSPPAPGDVVTLETKRVYPGDGNAQSIAGFPVYFPTYLPEGYHPLTDPPIELVINSQGRVASAEVMFVDQSGEHLLYLKQYPIAEDDEVADIPLGSAGASVESVAVNGQGGLWLENFEWGTHANPETDNQLVEYNLLIWTQPAGPGSELYFWLGSQEQLPMSELMRVAESLALNSPGW